MITMQITSITTDDWALILNKIELELLLQKPLELETSNKLNLWQTPNYNDNGYVYGNTRNYNRLHSFLSFLSMLDKDVHHDGIT